MKYFILCATLLLAAFNLSAVSPYQIYGSWGLYQKNNIDGAILEITSIDTFGNSTFIESGSLTLSGDGESYTISYLATGDWSMAADNYSGQYKLRTRYKTFKVNKSALKSLPTDERIAFQMVIDAMLSPFTSGETISYSISYISDTSLKLSYLGETSTYSKLY